MSCVFYCAHELLKSTDILIACIFIPLKFFCYTLYFNYYTYMYIIHAVYYDYATSLLAATCNQPWGVAIIGLTYLRKKNPPMNELILSEDASLNFSWKTKPHLMNVHVMYIHKLHNHIPNILIHHTRLALKIYIITRQAILLGDEANQIDTSTTIAANLYKHFGGLTQPSDAIGHFLNRSLQPLQYL